MAERVALLVGIDDYGGHGDLSGCCNDARRLAEVLGSHHGGARNFTCRKLTSDEGSVTRAALRKELHRLFQNERKDLLFYFAGHAVVSTFGPELVTQDFTSDPFGLAMSNLADLANASRANNVFLILDCCHSGAMADNTHTFANANASWRENHAILSEGVQILAATTGNDLAGEDQGYGLFTRALIDGLEGDARDALGNVTLQSLYSYTSARFGPFDQAPVFKGYSSSCISLRNCKPIVQPELLKDIVRIFPDPSLPVATSPDMDDLGQRKKLADCTPAQRIYYALQDYRSAQFLDIDQHTTLWRLMQDSRPIYLSSLGKHYWQLVHERGA